MGKCVYTNMHALIALPCSDDYVPLIPELLESSPLAE